MIAFSDEPQQLSDFTNSVEDIQGRLLYTVPKGRTALLDAIYLGIEKMRQAKYQKKALLIISDGGDNRSRYTEGEIRNLVKEADVLIYAIGIYDNYFPTEEERLGPQLLDDIAQITGGRAFTVENPNAWRMLPKRSALSSATSMCSVTAPRILRTMESGIRST